jgi:hypothetical protein
LGGAPVCSVEWGALAISGRFAVTPTLVAPLRLLWAQLGAATVRISRMQIPRAGCGWDERLKVAQAVRPISSSGLMAN